MLLLHNCGFCNGCMLHLLTVLHGRNECTQYSSWAYKPSTKEIALFF
jgi:hypothetical protein